MRALCIAPLLSLCCMAAASAQARHPPRFSDYPVRERYRGRPAPVVLDRPEVRQFRTVLSEGALRGPNFAGHYTVVEWGCGSPCVRYAIVDARTGRVWMAPESATHGTEHRLDSSLLVRDPPELWRRVYGDQAKIAIGGYASSTYYRWTGARLVAIDSVAVGENAGGPRLPSRP